MKRSARPFLLAWLALCTVASAATAQQRVRVLTYNIHAGKDVKQQVNLERVRDIIQQTGADVVLLQEVDRGTERAGGADHLAELARLTGMHSAFGRTLNFQGGEYGIALLSRWPLDSVRVLPYAVHVPVERARESYEPRVALYAQLQAGGRRLHVVNTHLDHAAEPLYRHQEVMGLLAFVQRALSPGEALIAGGDLNARDDAPEIAALSLTFVDAWRRCGNGGPGSTFPAHAPDRRIDYVMLRGPRCSQAEVLAADASDHRPLLVTIEF